MSTVQRQFKSDHGDNLQSKFYASSNLRNDIRHLNVYNDHNKFPHNSRSQYHSIQQLSSSGKSDRNFQNFTNTCEEQLDHEKDSKSRGETNCCDMTFPPYRKTIHHLHNNNNSGELKSDENDNNIKEIISEQRTNAGDSRSPDANSKIFPNPATSSVHQNHPWSKNFFEQYRQRMMASVAMALAGNFRPNVLFHHYLRHSFSDLGDASCPTNCSKNGDDRNDDRGNDSNDKSNSNQEAQDIFSSTSEFNVDSKNHEMRYKDIVRDNKIDDDDDDGGGDDDDDDDGRSDRKMKDGQTVKMEMDDEETNEIEMETRDFPSGSISPSSKFKQTPHVDLPFKRPKRKQYIPQQHESSERKNDPETTEVGEYLNHDDSVETKNDYEDDEDDQPLAKMKCTRQSPLELESTSDEDNNNCKSSYYKRDEEDRKTSQMKFHHQQMAEIGMRNYMVAMMQARMDQHQSNADNLWPNVKSESDKSRVDSQRLNDGKMENEQLKERNLLALQVAQQMEKFSMLAAQNSGDPEQAENVSKMLKMEIGGFINGIVDNIMSGWLLHQQQKILQQNIQENRNHKPNDNGIADDKIKLECEEEPQTDASRKKDKTSKENFREEKTEFEFKKRLSEKNYFDHEMNELKRNSNEETNSNRPEKSSIFGRKTNQELKASSSTISSPANSTSDSTDIPQSRSPAERYSQHFFHPLRNAFLSFPMNSYFTGHFMDNQADQTRSDQNSSPNIINDKQSSPKLFPSNVLPESFNESSRSFIHPPMYKSSMVPPFYPPALSRFKSLFMSMKESTEQTEAIPLVVNTPKKKRTKVTDTRLSPRAARAMLHESYSNHHQGHFDPIKQDMDVPLSPLEIFNYHLCNNPGSASIMQNFTDLFKHSGYMAHSQSTINPELVNSFARNPRGEEFPHLQGQPHHLSHGGFFNLMRPGLSRTDHVNDSFRKSPTGCHPAGIPFRDLPRHSSHVNFPEGAYPSASHHPFRFHHPMFMSRHHSRHGLSQHHPANLKTHHHQAPSLLKYGSDVPYEQQDGHNLTSTLTPMHLRKAKLMFFYVRYPSSAILKIYFPDVRFNKNNTAQLVKWFSNFREFYYIQMEKYARQALAEGVKNVTDLVVGTDSELYRVLVLHYNRNNQIEVPENFRFVVQATLREFYLSIAAEKDQEQSWKKSIYKVIARMDDVVPEYFKSPNWMEQLADQ